MANEERGAIYRDVVRAEWVDYNGHLRDAFYMLVFSFATDALLDVIGLDDEQRRSRHRSVYTLEAHVNYLHEIKEGVAIEVIVRVLAHDSKRMHLYLEMHADGHAGPVAASEQMMLHVETKGPSGPRAAPFDPDVFDCVRKHAAASAMLPPPSYTGRAIGLRRERSQLPGK